LRESEHGQQKIFGEQQCRNNWILNIDADEEVSNELSQEIIGIFNQKLTKIPILKINTKEQSVAMIFCKNVVSGHVH
jgi:hypothetical protein